MVEFVGTTAIVVYCLCAFVVCFIVAAVSFYCATKLRRRQQQPPPPPHSSKLLILSFPVPGRYPSPLEVRLSTTAHSTRDILVQIIYQDRHEHSHGRKQQKRNAMEEPQQDEVVGDSGGHSNYSIPADFNHPWNGIGHGEEEGTTLRGFLLYRDPLFFIKPGTYRIFSTTTEPDGGMPNHVQVFTFEVVKAAVCDRVGQPNVDTLLRAPVIVPSSGEVTTATRIHLNLGPNCTGSAAIRYSLDGSFPCSYYTGPFVLALQSNSVPSQVVEVRAISVNGEEVSDVVVARLTVVPSSVVVFDPTIRAPTAKIQAVNPVLYFGNVESNAYVEFVIEYLSEVRLQQQTHHPQHHRPRGNGIENIYTYTAPVMIRDDVARVRAWSVSSEHPNLKSDEVIYTASLFEVSAPVLPPSSLRRPPRNCPAPPTICVACSEVSLSFDEVAGRGMILYSVDGTEPTLEDSSMSTHILQYGQKLELGRLENTAVAINARIFVEPTDGSGVTRFGQKFSREFSLNE